MIPAVSPSKGPPYPGRAAVTPCCAHDRQSAPLCAVSKALGSCSKGPAALVSVQGSGSPMEGERIALAWVGYEWKEGFLEEAAPFASESCGPGRAVLASRMITGLCRKIRQAWRGGEAGP